MDYQSWKQALVFRVGTVAAAFLAGMVVEAVRGYSAWGIGVVVVFLGLLAAGLLVAADPLLERLYERERRRRASQWPEF